MLFPWRQLAGCATGMGGYDGHVVMATIANGSCTSEVVTRVSQMEMLTGEPFELV